MADQKNAKGIFSDGAVYDNGILKRAQSPEEWEKCRRQMEQDAEDAQKKRDELKVVNHAFRKKDAMQLVTGKPVYVDDITPKNCLAVKLLRSPHANAVVEEIQTEAAMKVPGMVRIFTWKDVDQNAKRYTQAGQTYPEFSPYDRLLIDRHVRFAGDVVAVLAGETLEAVEKAMRLVKVKYQVLPAVLDYRKAKDNPVLVHPEENWEALVAAANADNKRNLCAHDECGEGDVEKVLADCDVVIDRVYHTPASQQAMMETFRTYCDIDEYGRLNIISSTQIVFHVRRIVANALHIPKSKIHVRKPRIGGGFGAKQTAVSEVYPAMVTWMLKRPSKLIFTREESQIASSPRHEMELHVRLGASKDGRIRAIDLYTLSNTGAYGEHGPTTVGLSGHKTIPLYGKAEAFRFVNDVVYTNVMSAGAYRGYGATQGCFAVESAVNELADRLGIDPFELRVKNIIHQGDVMPAYYGETATSCALDRCVEHVRRISGWDVKPHREVLPDGRIRSMGCAITMQGSGISGVDVGSASLKLNDDGFYILRIAAADMGTGCDTTLAQVAAEVLECPLDKVVTSGADTDTSPYDSGSYASSTAYVTGKAVEKCALELRSRIVRMGAEMLGVSAENCDFDGTCVRCGEQAVSMTDIATRSMCNNTNAVEVTVSNTSPTSPPPFMASVAELITDPETGEVRTENFYGVVDCGTPLNPALARVQTEGGVLQGIGMALTERVDYNRRGRMMQDSLMQYRIPTRNDIGHLNIEFESSYEGSGPFGAKSIGEVVINTPGPSIAEAVYQAVGRRIFSLPVTPEKVLFGEDYTVDQREIGL